MEESKKRLKIAEQEEALAIEGNMLEDSQNQMICSEEMETRINAILEKIDHFTELVSEMLEAGKTIFKELASKFEDQLIQMHAQQLEKWQEEIKELRFLDTSNEETIALLQNTRSHLLQNFHDNF